MSIKPVHNFLFSPNATAVLSLFDLAYNKWLGRPFSKDAGTYFLGPFGQLNTRVAICVTGKERLQKTLMLPSLDDAAFGAALYKHLEHPVCLCSALLWEGSYWWFKAITLRARMTIMPVVALG